MRTAVSVLRVLGGCGGFWIGLTPLDIQVAEEVMVPQDVEVETRVNPLPSYPTKYE